MADLQQNRRSYDTCISMCIYFPFLTFENIRVFWVVFIMVVEAVGSSTVKNKKTDEKRDTKFPDGSVFRAGPACLHHG